MRVPQSLQTTFDYYLRAPADRVGYGRQPAVVVVDMIRAFTDPAGPLTMDVAEALPAAKQLLDAARGAHVPIIFTTTAYDADLTAAGVWKRKASRVLQWLTEGSDWVEVDPRLGRRPDEPLISKSAASAFFGTDLVSRLVTYGTDTLLIAGIRTSTCIRATAIDACAYGLHTIVVQDTVADVFELPHYANLVDVDSKYGDVVELDSAISYFHRLDA